MAHLRGSRSLGFLLLKQHDCTLPMFATPVAETDTCNQRMGASWSSEKQEQPIPDYHNRRYREHHRRFDIAPVRNLFSPHTFSQPHTQLLATSLDITSQGISLSLFYASSPNSYLSISAITSSLVRASTKFIGCKRPAKYVHSQALFPAAFGGATTSKIFAWETIYSTAPFLLLHTRSRF
jgi:hypothetical protein